MAISVPPTTPTTLDADFECAYVPNVIKVSDTHFVLDFKERDEHWFMFRLKGVAGKTVRIDLKTNFLEKWFTLNPVYQYADGAVAAMSLPLPSDDFHLSSVKLIDGHNGTRFPDTSNQPGGWHFIPEVWTTSGRHLSFIHTYEKDTVTIAMRQPFTLADEADLMAEVRKDTAPADMKAQVMDVGTTPQGRTLHIVKFSSGGEVGEKAHPCILMYAREHADEHDASWPVAGAIKRLLQNDNVTKDLRERFTFMFIPILDMDLAAKGGHERVIDAFLPERTVPESLAYAKFFQSWMHAGKPLEIVFNFHAMISNEGDMMAAAMFPPADSPFFAPTQSLHNRILVDERNRGFRVLNFAWYRGYSPERLGGWLGNTYGAIHQPYEINMQEQHRHLNAAETLAMGPVLLQSTTSYLETDSGKALIRLTEMTHRKYLTDWRKFSDQVAGENAVYAEWKVRTLGG